MRSKKGKSFNTRGVVANKPDGTVAQGNQWQASEQQLKWLNLYMNPKEKLTYGNPYQSAISAGYSESYAKTIMNPSTALQWVKSARSIMRTLNTEHLKSLLEDISTNEYEKAADRIAAIKLLGTEQGMFVQRQVTAHIGIEGALRELE